MNSSEILRFYFKRKQDASSGFSLRSLASRMKLSPSYTSKILCGKKPLPLDRVKSFAKGLGLDPIAERKLVKTLVKEKNCDLETQVNVEAISTEASDRMKTAALDTYWLLEKWYFLPLLALIECSNFEPTGEWLGSQLGISTSEAQQAWEKLTKSGIVEEQNGKWIKCENKIIFPNAKSTQLFKKFYIEMLNRSAKFLERSSADDFSKRLVLGASVTSNEESMLKAKKYLEESFCKAAEIMDSGPREQVYYLSVQVLPQSKG